MRTCPEVPPKFHLEALAGFLLITHMILAALTGTDVFIMIFSTLLGVAWVVLVHKFLKGDGFDAGQNDPDSEEAAGHGHEHGHSHHGH